MSKSGNDGVLICPTGGDNPIPDTNDRDTICPTTGYWVEGNKFCGGGTDDAAMAKCMTPWSTYGYDDCDSSCNYWVEATGGSWPVAAHWASDNGFYRNILGSSQQSDSKCVAYSRPGEDKMKLNNIPGAAWDTSYEEGKDNPRHSPGLSGESDW